MDALLRAWSKPRRGQTLIVFTLMITGLFAFAALVINLGFLYGQRRYDQNGADAGALAAARYMAANVSPLNAAGSTVQFSVTDAEVYAVVRTYGGLDPATTTSAPTGTNQNAGLNATNQLALDLEYAPDGVTWCYSPANIPAKSPACSLPTGNAPPLPGTTVYKVRVTVQSTTASALGTLLPSMATSAKTIAVIAGSPTYLGVASLIPVVAPNCQVAPGPGNALYQLWGSSGSVCTPPFSYGSWASVVELTGESKWCDESGGGSGSNPDYKYQNLLPLLSHVGGGQCQLNPSIDLTWNNPVDSVTPGKRTGFAADATHGGSGVVNDDLQWWIAKGFNGAVAVGNKLPTYLDAKTDQGGNQGQNIAAGFYCSPSGLAGTACSTSVNIAGTYFFASNQPGFHDVCPDQFGAQYGAGCRDATVVTWINAEAPQGPVAASNNWHSVNSAPDRIEVARLLNFRFYCDHVSGTCTDPPKSVVGNAANSAVWGRFVSPFFSPCPTCTGGPSLNGNTVNLGS